jgi:hypothetical protein
VSEHHTTAQASEEPESVARQLARLRRDAVAGRADPDTAFLSRVVGELGTLLARAVASLDEIGKRSERLSDPEAPGIARLAHEAARWLNLQGGHHGTWFRTDTVRPTQEPASAVEVLYCSARGRMPIHGLYVTDSAGHASWEIYSGLQDYLLEYKGPEPVLWCFAPPRPPEALWAQACAPEDRPLLYGQDRFAAALAEDLASAGIPIDAQALLALPSLHRVLRESEQIRAAYLRTADALGVPANAHGPAERARALVDPLRQGAAKTGSQPDPK